MEQKAESSEGPQADGVNVYSVLCESTAGRGKGHPSPTPGLNNGGLAWSLAFWCGFLGKRKDSLAGFPGNWPPPVGAGQKSSH